MLSEMFLLCALCLLMLHKWASAGQMSHLPEWGTSSEFLDTHLAQSFSSPYRHCPSREASDLRVRAAALQTRQFTEQTGCLYKVKSGRALIWEQTHSVRSWWWQQQFGSAIKTFKVFGTNKKLTQMLIRLWSLQRCRLAPGPRTMATRLYLFIQCYCL